MPVAAMNLKARHASLATSGLAVEYFPGYVNRTQHLHALDVVLLSFIIRGRGSHYIDDERFTERGASLAVTHYGQRHDIVTGPRGMDVFNIYLDLPRHTLPVLPDALQPMLPLLLPLHPRFAHRQNRIVRLQFADPQPLARELFAMEHEQRTQAPGYQDAMHLHWTLFLLACCRQAQRDGFVPPPLAPAGVEAVRLQLDHRYAAAHTLTALAQRAGLSPTALCRAFKAHTGKRVFDYLIERRIQAAMLRLRGSRDKVAAVALACGFRDLSYFNRTFKRLLGLTPSAYRATP